VEKVKLICGVMTSREDLLESFAEALAEEFGPVDLESDVFPFNHTAYYEEEMGSGLVKKILSFEHLIDPGAIGAIKLRTIEMEGVLTDSTKAKVGRVVNLDPGYVGMLKLVLATTKDRTHRIYLHDGIFAEVTLQFVNGGFEPLPWTYPDYRLSGYIEFLDSVRLRLKRNLQSESH
jgi:hypothetical protein